MDTMVVKAKKMHTLLKPVIGAIAVIVWIVWSNSSSTVDSYGVYLFVCINNGTRGSSITLNF